MSAEDQPQTSTGPTSSPTAGPRPRRRSSPTFNDKQQVDYVRELTAKNVWYYRDRLSVPRGPCNLPVLRECWCSGIIDENTLVWGQGLGDWLPVKNVKTLVPQIRTVEVQFVTFMKKHLALKPALHRMQRQRAAVRHFQTPQITEMY